MVSPDQKVRFDTGAAELLDRVGPLWLELRRHHAEIAPLWRASLLGASFEDRRDALVQKASSGLYVLLATVAGRDVGYCICTVDAHGQGEVDSIYVAEDHRRRGLGHALMRDAMRWLSETSTSAIVVDVLYGNSAAMKLYEGFGFHPRQVRLRHVGVNHAD